MPPTNSGAATQLSIQSAGRNATRQGRSDRKVRPNMTNHILAASQKLLADIHVDPNNDGLPGVNAALKIVGALLTFGLIAAVAGIAIGSMVWAVGSHTSNPHHASRGKTGVIVRAGAAILVGSAVTIVNFFSHTNLGF
jgi:hypothetical protein